MLQPVRVDRVRRAGVALAVDRCDSHLVHQRARVLAVHRKALPLEHIAQHPCNGEREFQVQRLDAPHQQQVRLGHGPRQVIDIRARELQQLGRLTRRS